MNNSVDIPFQDSRVNRFFLIIDNIFIIKCFITSIQIYNLLFYFTL